MNCATCESDLPASMRFCPSCGSPGPTTSDGPATRVIELGDETSSRRRASVLAPPVRDTGPFSRVEPYPDDAPRDSAAAPPTGSTTVLPADTTAISDSGNPDSDVRNSGHRDGTSVGDRVAPAAREAKQRARRFADRFTALPIELRIAVVGAVVTVLSFLAFDYAAGLGEPVEVSGRLWLLPIAAIAATALLFGSMLRRAVAAADPAEVPRRTDGLLAAVVISSAGAVEAGLFSLLTGDVVGPRAGFYGMLIGLVVVMVACVRAARRTLR